MVFVISDQLDFQGCVKKEKIGQSEDFFTGNIYLPRRHSTFIGESTDFAALKYRKGNV